MPQKRRFFGTDGIRGPVNQHPLTSNFVHAMGMATVAWLNQRGATSKRPTVVIGRDTRRSGTMLEAAFAAGFCSLGGDVLSVGVLPTPGIAFLTQQFRADVGLVISASHNPYQDNGLKFFDKDGLKLLDTDELEIEALIDKALNDELDRAEPEQVGAIKIRKDGPSLYVDFLKHLWSGRRSLEDVKIVLDCANGAAFEVAPALFKALGVEVISIADQPDGININVDCGALHTKNAQQRVLEEGAIMGFAFDGDADRLMAIDEKGEVLDGDVIMAVCAPRLAASGQLPGNVVVATVMSNLGLEHALKKEGIRLIRTPVGDRYVKEEMKELGATLGGEQSGHLIFSQHATTGDGLVGALQVLLIQQQEEKPLSELAAVMTRVPQVLRNVKIREKKDWRTIPEISDAVKKAESELGSEGRVLVRYSGTENKARVMVEGPTLEQIDVIAIKIAQAFEDALGL